MSVEDFGNPEGHALAAIDPPPEDCFYCGKPLEGLVVHWSGFGGSITLHGPCAEKLGSRLTFDARRAEWILQRRPLDSGIGREVRPYLAKREAS